MAAANSFRLLSLLAILLLAVGPELSSATTRKLASLVLQQPLVLKYHNGPLLKGNLTLNLLWYGSFSPAQRAVILNFLRSLSPPTSSAAPSPNGSPSSAAPSPNGSPSVASWWRTTERYKGGPATLSVGNQVFDDRCSLGKLIKSPQLRALALKSVGGKSSNGNAINLVLTAADVAVEGFCMSRCGTHGPSGPCSAYAWVGNSASQCPGQCAWPFHQPIYGPQTPPLVAPNGDVGVDGMITNLATVLAGAVTNPFSNGYFQGPANAPLEAVSACTGIFGKGAYPGYPGAVLTDKTTGASYNAVGLNGRKYLLPAMWDPATSTCSTLV